MEQRNWTHVRKLVGYRRMDNPAELELPREPYAKICLYKNYFQPAMKLKEKIREGGESFSPPRTR